MANKINEQNKSNHGNTKDKNQEQRHQLKGQNELKVEREDEKQTERQLVGKFTQTPRPLPV